MLSNTVRRYRVVTTLTSALQIAHHKQSVEASEALLSSQQTRSGLKLWLALPETDSSATLVVKRCTNLLQRYGEARDGAFVGRITQVVGSQAVHVSVAGDSPREYNISTTRSVVDEEKAELANPATDSFLAFLLRKIRLTIKTTFMPAGYPDTVGEKYMEYILWAGVTNFSITANSVLASTFMLYSVGLGAGAIPTAGALNWVLKDGMGQLGTLLFGKAIAHNFDVHSKTWFFLSSVKLKVATGLELATMLAPQYFLIMGSVANTIKGLAWMASGSTRSVFNLSYVRDNNIADITAKSVSQYIFASLLGTAAGAWAAAYIGQTYPLACGAYALLTATTLVSSYMSVKCIPLATLNNTRLQLVTEAFLTSISKGPSPTAVGSGNPVGVVGRRTHLKKGELMMVLEPNTDHPADRCYINPHLKYDRVYDDSQEPQIPTPVELSPLDPPLPQITSMAQRLEPKIVVGARLEDVVEGNAQVLVMLINTFKYAHFLLLPKPDGLHIILHERANARDIIQAYLQACIMRRRIKDGLHVGLEPYLLTQQRLALTESLATAERLTTIFMTALEANKWTLEKVVVEAERRRATW